MHLQLHIALYLYIIAFDDNKGMEKFPLANMYICSYNHILGTCLYTHTELL